MFEITTMETLTCDNYAQESLFNINVNCSVQVESSCLRCAHFDIQENFVEFEGKYLL